MKLRVKFRKRRHLIEIPDETAPTFLLLKEKLCEALSVTTVFVSLNGSDVIQTDDDKLLSDLDIVSGDLIHVQSDDAGEQDTACDPTNTVNNLPGKATTSRISGITVYKGEQNHQNGIEDEESTNDKSNGQQQPASTSEFTMDYDADDNLTETRVPEPSDPEVNRYLNEPILIRESSSQAVPQTLIDLYACTDCDSVVDAVVVVLHVLMLECKFSTLNETDSCSMPHGWKQKSKGHYRIDYTHPECEGFTFTILHIPVGPTLLVKGQAKCSETEDEYTYKLHLKPGDFVTEFQNHPRDAAQMFTNLQKLSMKFKDRIANPLIENNRTNFRQIPGTLLHIISLFEAKACIAKYLKVQHILTLSSVCKHLNEEMQEPHIWRMLYLKRFGSRGNNSLNLDWRILFKGEYKLEQERAARRRQMIRDMRYENPYIGLSSLEPPPFGPVRPPGAIGGDYDLDPFGGHHAAFGGPQNLFSGQQGSRLLPRPRRDPFNPFGFGSNPRPHFGGPRFM